ncbi:Hsp20/alpha crystallin family protein [Candidatus Latescibacterota bacterium]
MLPAIWRTRGSLIGPQLDDLFGRFFYGLPSFERNLDTAWSPRVDIHETDKEFLIDVELPGLEKKDIKVEVRDNTLTVSGERNYEKTAEDGETSRVERHYGKFERTFGLPDTVKTEKVNAEYKNGVLALSLPKSEKAIPKEINIEVK